MRKNFGSFLENLLEKNNITQRDFASKINVAEATISRYIHNVQVPRLDVISKMAVVLNVTTDYLLGNEPKNLTAELEHDEKTLEMVKQFRKVKDEDKDKLIDMIKMVNRNIQDEDVVV